VSRCWSRGKGLGLRQDQDHQDLIQWHGYGKYTHIAIFIKDVGAQIEAQEQDVAKRSRRYDRGLTTETCR